MTDELYRGKNNRDRDENRSVIFNNNKPDGRTDEIKKSKSLLDDEK